MNYLNNKKHNFKKCIYTPQALHGHFGQLVRELRAMCPGVSDWNVRGLPRQV